VLGTESERLNKTLKDAPHGDIHIFPIGERLEMTKIVHIVESAQRSCLFVFDSGLENILA